MRGEDDEFIVKVIELGQGQIFVYFLLLDLECNLQITVAVGGVVVDSNLADCGSLRGSVSVEVLIRDGDHAVVSLRLHQTAAGATKLELKLNTLDNIQRG